MNNDIYDIAFSFDESITPIEKIALHREFKSSKRILELNKSTLKNILGRKWTGNRFNKKEFIERAIDVMPYIKKSKIKYLRYDMDNYPYGLKSIPDHPFLIYYKGNIKYDYNRSIAMVGTRKPDFSGLNRSKIFTEVLVNEKFCIISGLAIGIDTSCHYNCINNNGKTIAVLGCGIDRIYPYINKKLAKMILDKGGGLISEYPPGIKPNKWNFPKRNRIIVGLSRAVMIVQSPSRSGSLISAMLAGDYNKDLYVASIGGKYEKNDMGNLELIRSGAIEVNNANEILNDLVDMSLN